VAPGPDVALADDLSTGRFFIGSDDGSVYGFYRSDSFYKAPRETSHGCLSHWEEGFLPQSGPVSPDDPRPPCRYAGVLRKPLPLILRRTFLLGCVALRRRMM
jgi:hypothetical protein